MSYFVKRKRLFLTSPPQQAFLAARSIAGCHLLRHRPAGHAGDGARPQHGRGAAGSRVVVSLRWRRSSPQHGRLGYLRVKNCLIASGYLHQSGGLHAPGAGRLFALHDARGRQSRDAVRRVTCFGQEFCCSLSTLSVSVRTFSR
jgi:hypothetical protein